MPLSGEYEPGTSAWARKQAERFETSNGEKGADLEGRPVIVVTSIGARTGNLRKTALMRVEHGGVYAVVASLGGAPKHPVWYHNLKANPLVELQDGPTRHDYTAREVAGDEKMVWWARAVETWPQYARYQKKTDRQIPVFVLENKASGRQTVGLVALQEVELCHGWVDTQTRRIDEERHAIRFVPRRSGSNWSAKNRRMARRLLEEGRIKAAGSATLPADL